ncbi:MFS general substrate transporter [Xylariaceae sp. FL0594]|nr:MFS general substrate transporter [Xylariaceae sp. FL0594]
MAEEEDVPKPPLGLRWRSSPAFVIATVAVGMFTDLFLYGLIVPVLPFMLHSRLAIPEDRVQTYVSNLLAAYAGASVASSLPAGWIADRAQSRQTPFLSGLAALLAATVMLAVGRNIAVLTLARVLQGVSASVVWTIGLAMVMDTVGPQNLGKAIGTIFSFTSIGQLMAPVIGGILYEKTGYTGVFCLGAGLLVIDFVMRLLVVEKKIADRYHHVESSSSSSSSQQENSNAGEEEGEERPLLSNNNKKDDSESYKVHDAEHNALTRSFPILACFRNPRVAMSMALAFVQACLLAVYDATIPTEAQSLFGFTSLQAGLLFIALDVPYLLLGPFAGWAVDRFGTKPAAVLGFGWMVPALVLLRLPPQVARDGSGNAVALYSALLALNGVGLAIIGAPSVVEASEVVQRYHKANPDFFGANGPYAQLYGFNSLFFCAGLTVGPLLAGVLKDSVGYGDMNLVFAVLSGVTAVLSFFIIGGRPGFLARKRVGEDR